MSVTVVGIELNKPYDFTDRNTGVHRSGSVSHLYVVQDKEHNESNKDGYSFIGSKVEDIKLSPDIDVSALAPGDRVNLFYDQSRRCSHFIPV